MAKIKTLGASVVVVSSVKLEELKKLKKYDPEALVLHGGEDGKEEIFRAGMTTGKGSLGEYGAEFSPATQDGFATITLDRDDLTSELTAEAVCDQYGAALALLIELEAQIPEALAKAEAKRAAVMENIDIG